MFITGYFSTSRKINQEPGNNREIMEWSTYFISPENNLVFRSHRKHFKNIKLTTNLGNIINLVREVSRYSPCLCAYSKQITNINRKTSI